jgi:hypothetical protein
MSDCRSIFPLDPLRLAAAFTRRVLPRIMIRILHSPNLNFLPPKNDELRLHFPLSHGLTTTRSRSAAMDVRPAIHIQAIRRNFSSAREG